MALEMRQVHIPMDITIGTKERERGSATFRGKVRSAEAMLKGFNIRYTNGDHHVLEQEIDLDVVRIDGNTVEIAADFLSNLQFFLTCPLWQTRIHPHNI